MWREFNHPSNDNASKCKQPRSRMNSRWPQLSATVAQLMIAEFRQFTYIAFLFQISTHFNARNLKVFGQLWLLVATLFSTLRLFRRNRDVCRSWNFLHHKLLHRITVCWFHFHMCGWSLCFDLLKSSELYFFSNGMICWFSVRWSN